MLFNPGLEEAAGAKLKIILGNYLKVYDISRQERERLFKTLLLKIVTSNIVLYRKIYAHDEFIGMQTVLISFFFFP